MLVRPIEIRLSQDRLSFVSRLLSSNEDAYRHPDVLLDLIAKLGYRFDSIAEVRTLAMLADSALQAGDFTRAADMCDRMVLAVEGLKKQRHSTLSSPGGPHSIEVARDIVWRNCFQLGKHCDFKDIPRRMRLLGHSLTLCPGDEVATLLHIWISLENQLSVSRGGTAIPTDSTFKLSGLKITPNPLLGPTQYLSALSSVAAARSLKDASAYLQRMKME